jgi:hypothetical protein
MNIPALTEHVKLLNQHIERVGKYAFAYYSVRAFLNDPAGTIIDIIRHVATMACWGFILGSIAILVTTWGILGWLGIEWLLGHHAVIEKFLHK